MVALPLTETPTRVKMSKTGPGILTGILLTLLDDLRPTQRFLVVTQYFILLLGGGDTYKKSHKN